MERIDLLEKGDYWAKSDNRQLWQEVKKMLEGVIAGLEAKNNM